MRDLHLSLNQTQRVRLQAALDQLESYAASTAAAAASVTVADTIPVNHEDNILKWVNAQFSIPANGFSFLFFSWNGCIELNSPEIYMLKSKSGGMARRI